MASADPLRKSVTIKHRPGFQPAHMALQCFSRKERRLQRTPGVRHRTAQHVRARTTAGQLEMQFRSYRSGDPPIPDQQIVKDLSASHQGIRIRHTYFPE